MITDKDTAFALFKAIERKASAYIDLFVSETQADFEAAFTPILDKAITDLETAKTHFAELDEEGLSAVLAMGLSIPGLTVTRETDSNGHVDITITADHSSPIRRKLAEAKIYNGPQYHLGGLSQLLGRYTTGRETNGLIITYVRQKDIKGLMNKVRDRMDEVLPENQIGKTEDFVLKWSFSSKHKHNCGEDLQVDHVGCNLDCS